MLDVLVAFHMPVLSQVFRSQDYNAVLYCLREVMYLYFSLLPFGYHRARVVDILIFTRLISKLYIISSTLRFSSCLKG